ncbi:ABC transporter substrate-binding protein [Hymenobacter busanensis]|uniref:ABC transporter substrate-binding protein n=1 Tax=Hymenobacter busanensis TaxID=2607656 RepID=A0A7L5A1H1_9BACT|nr:ABC transporter substrate-binding protein [Hymenobacter busanensis]KAA9338207.1 ABC transporter substrate-binding protein [Hymenobacter busanensis]QHJ09368.1 ABC transporter substrate-binding protein [Hymenobacter busanensis]
MPRFLACLGPFRASAALLLSLSFLASCGTTEQPADERRVFRYNQPEALTSLDPAFARSQANIWAVTQLYNGLVELDDSLRPAPALARRYDISPDGLRYTFVLRPGVRFHDSEVFPSGKGRAVTAPDVVYSFQRLLDKPTASPGGWIFRGKVLENAAGEPSDTAFVAPNDSTVRVYLKEPFIPFLGILTMPYAYVVPREAVARYGKDFREHPVGTGPFQFRRWDEGSAIVYHRNPHYWRRDAQGQPLPYLDAVLISFISDRKTEFLTFQQGKLDFLSGIREGSRDLVMNPDGSVREDFAGKFRLQKVPYLNTEYLGFQLDPANLRGEANQPALRDRRVRQALSYAINRPELLAYFINNVGRPGTSGFVPSSLPSFDEKAVPGYTYQPAKARELLRAAGYGPGGKPLRLHLSTVVERKEICEYLQKKWAELGIDVAIDINQAAAHQELVDNGRAAFFTKSWLGDYPDAENYLALFYSPNFSPAGPNKTHFKSPAYDKLYEQAKLERNDQRRWQLYQAMDRLVVAEAPVLSLYYDEVVRLTQNNVHGLTPNPMNQLVLERVRKD